MSGMLDDDQDVWADTIFSSCKKAKLGFSLRLERMKMSLCHLARAVFHLIFPKYMSWEKFNLIIRLLTNLVQIYLKLFLRKFK